LSRIGPRYSTYDLPVNRYRIIFSLLGLALAAVAFGAILLAPSGTPATLPDVLEGYSPTDGSTVLRQIEIAIDLPVNYEIVLVVDGTTIPNDEINTIPQTGIFTWRPDETTMIPEWTPGIHTVWVRWDRVNGLPDPGEWTWRFRAQ
jgi:hypothetical protein